VGGAHVSEAVAVFVSLQSFESFKLLPVNEEFAVEVGVKNVWFDVANGMTTANETAFVFQHVHSEFSD